MRKLVKLCDNAVQIGENVFFYGMVHGERKLEKCPVQGAIVVDGRGRATRELRRRAAEWKLRRLNEVAFVEDGVCRTPTFGELKDLYLEAAEESQLKNGVPVDRTIRTSVQNFTYLVEGCGFKWEDKVSLMTTEKLDEYAVRVIRKGSTPTTAWSYVMGIKSIAPKWARSFYRRKGFEVPEVALPVMKSRKPARYVRPPAERLAAVKAWYQALEENADKRFFLAATMMLQFAMRNDDVELLTWANFRRVGDQVKLCYTPNKTKDSSKRDVRWPVHPEIFAKMLAAAGKTEKEVEGLEELVVPHANYVLRQMCGALRTIGFTGNKACYELRKICVDHVYHRLGAEMASAISGDDIRTVQYYYADPGETGNVEAPRIDQLL